MLKLEKRHREISIAVRGKERRYNSTFLKALGIAFVIHFIGFILFQVGSFISESNVILPPSLVESDIYHDTRDNFVSANFEKEGGRQRDALEPPLTEMKIPIVSVSVLPKHLNNKGIIVSNSVASLEEDWVHALREETIQAYDPIQVHISGALAEIALLKDGIPKGKDLRVVLQNLKMKEPDRVAFVVQIEHTTGHVFWKMQTKAGDTPLINALAEQILKEMCFEIKSMDFVTAGEIEIVFKNILS